MRCRRSISDGSPSANRRSYAYRRARGNSLTHLQQRTAAARIVKGDKEGHRTQPHIHEVEDHRREEIVAAEEAGEQDRPHALEDISRWQRPGGMLEPDGQYRHRIIDTADRRQCEYHGP